MIDIVNDNTLIAPIKEKLGVEALAIVIMNFDRGGIIEYDEMVSSLVGRVSYSYVPKRLDLNLKNRVTPIARLSIDEPPAF